MWTCLAPEQRAARGQARGRQERSLTVTRQGMRSPGPHCISPNKSGELCPPAEGQQAGEQELGHSLTCPATPPCNRPAVNRGDTFASEALCPRAHPGVGLVPAASGRLSGAEGTPEVPSTLSSSCLLLLLLLLPGRVPPARFRRKAPSQQLGPAPWAFGAKGDFLGATHPQWGGQERVWGQEHFGTMAPRKSSGYSLSKSPSNKKRAPHQPPLTPPFLKGGAAGLFTGSGIGVLDCRTPSGQRHPAGCFLTLANSGHRARDSGFASSAQVR